MKKKIKLFATIATLCLSLAMFTFGVFSALTVTYKTTGTISYDIEDTYVEIETRIYSTSKKYDNTATLKAKSQEFETSTFTTLDTLTTTGLVEGETTHDFNKVQIKNLDQGEDYTIQESDYKDTYSSVTATEAPEDLEVALKYQTAQGEDKGVYTYFVVTKLTNKSAVSLYAYTPLTGEDKYVAPENSHTYKAVGYKELTSLNDELYFVFAMTLNDITVAIDESNFVFPIVVTKDLISIPEADLDPINAGPNIGNHTEVAEVDQTNIDLSKPNVVLQPLSNQDTYIQIALNQTASSEYYSNFTIKNAEEQNQTYNLNITNQSTGQKQFILNLNSFADGVYTNVTSMFLNLENLQTNLFVFAGDYKSLDQAREQSTALTVTIEQGVNSFVITVQNATEEISVFLVHTAQNANILSGGIIAYFGVSTTDTNLAVSVEYNYISMQLPIEYYSSFPFGKLNFYHPNPSVNSHIEYNFSLVYNAENMTESALGLGNVSDINNIDFSEIIYVLHGQWTTEDAFVDIDTTMQYIISNNLTITANQTDGEITSITIGFDVLQEYLNEDGSFDITMFLAYDQEEDFNGQGISSFGCNVSSQTTDLNVAKLDVSYVEAVKKFALDSDFIISPIRTTQPMNFFSTIFQLSTFIYNISINNIPSDKTYLELTLDCSFEEKVFDYLVIYEGHYFKGDLIDVNATLFNQYIKMINYEDKIVLDIDLKLAKNDAINFCVAFITQSSFVANINVTPKFYEDDSILKYELKTDQDGNEYYSVVSLRDLSVKDVTVPSTYNGLPVLEIGEHAFANAPKLFSVTISEGVQKINKEAFKYSNIKKLNIPESVTYIESWAVDDCTILQTRNLSTYNGVTPGFGAMWDYWEELDTKEEQFTGVFSEYDENGVMFYTFEDKKFIVDYIGDSKIVDLSSYTDVYGLADRAFIGLTHVEKIILPEGMQWIGFEVFHHMPNLKELVIPSTVTQISECLFYNINYSEDLKIILKGNTFPEQYDISNYSASLTKMNWTLVVPKGSLANFSNEIYDYEISKIVEAE